MEHANDIPAFPLPVGDQECCGRFESGYGGMSLRDYFAAEALSIARAQVGPIQNHNGWRTVAETAYAIADAMLKEREGGHDR